ncbi:MAG: choice-of-anchor J domain-containing protein [Ferruginibacter sp.]
MIKSFLRSSFAYAVVILLGFQSCKDDSFLTKSLPVPDQSFNESFDNYQEAYNKGWRAINKSTPVGRRWLDVTETPVITSPNYVAIYYPEWNQAQFTLDSLQFGLSTPFPGRHWEKAYASQRASNGYVATSLASAEIINLTGPSVSYNVNNWLVSPELILQNGDKIVFYTYCKGVARLQLWVSESNTLNVGNDISDEGDFTINLIDINQGFDSEATNPAKAFPQNWTRFEGEVKGLINPVKGRFGFRYLILDGIPSAAATADELYNELHESVIGIDEVSFTSVH